MRFDEVVEPEALSVDLVLYHQVGELVDVARSLQNGLRRQHGAIDFQHLTRNEVLKQLASKQPSERISSSLHKYVLVQMKTFSSLKRAC
jgi:hypothetical protein